MQKQIIIKPSQKAKKHFNIVKKTVYVNEFLITIYRIVFIEYIINDLYNITHAKYLLCCYFIRKQLSDFTSSPSTTSTKTIIEGALQIKS